MSLIPCCRWASSVIFFSLNEIEKINDGLGYQVGDFVIKVMAQRFQQAFNVATKDVVPVTRYKVSITRKDIFIIILEPHATLKYSTRCELQSRRLFQSGGGINC